MIHEFRYWLPAGTPPPRAVQAALAELVDAWSREWFAGEALRALEALAPAAAERGLRETIWHVCEGLAIGMPEDALAALGAHAMGLAMRTGRSPADLALLEKLGAACLDDLKRRAASAFRLPPEKWHISEAQAGDAAYRLDIGTPALAPRLTLHLGAGLFAQLVRTRLTSPAAPPPLGLAVRALACIPVRLSATLGRCGISVAELSGIAPGDVLVLDRECGDPLPLALEYRPLKRGTCTVTRSGDALALQIVQAPIG